MRAKLTARDGNVFDLGAAAPDKAVIIRQMEHAYTDNFVQTLPITQHQLEVIERVRDGGDLRFTTSFYARGGSDKNNILDLDESGRAVCDFVIPQSDWIKRLKESSADEILIFEIRLPGKHGGGLTAPENEALALQAPLAEGVLKTLERGTKRDGEGIEAKEFMTAVQVQKSEAPTQGNLF